MRVNDVRSRELDNASVMSNRCLAYVSLNLPGADQMRSISCDTDSSTCSNTPGPTGLPSLSVYPAAVRSSLLRVTAVIRMHQYLSIFQHVGCQCWRVPSSSLLTYCLRMGQSQDEHSDAYMWQ